MNVSSLDQPPSSYHVVYLGEAGFPIGLGAIQRMTMVSKGLISEGCEVTVICRKGVLRGSDDCNISVTGNFEGIDYVYTSNNVFRPKGFIKRNFVKLKGMAREFGYLYGLKKANHLTAAIISNHSAHHLLRYRIYASVIGFPIVLNFVELASSMMGRKGFLVKLNDRIFDRYIVKIVDGALPISEKLMGYYQQITLSKPSLKVPILCDFKKFHHTVNKNSDTTFLYCGAAAYFELVDFIILAFDQLENLGEKVYLKLVLGGKSHEIRRIKKRIELSVNKERIGLVINVPHKDIPEHYAKAAALLIPLRPTIQDEARFPHKIGEYLASGRPMITTAYGEINHYDFIDEETALVALEYQVAAFAEKMQFVIDYPEKSREIGMRGRQMGLENFDYSKHGKALLGFLSILKLQKTKTKGNKN